MTPTVTVETTVRMSEMGKTPDPKPPCARRGLDAARANGHGDVGEPVVVLLGAHQQICRSNCLPKLAALGIGVQRRSAA